MRSNDDPEATDNPATDNSTADHQTSASKEQQGLGRTFLTIWAGQLASLLGTRLTRFAIGLWIFEQTQSVTDFSIFMLVVTLPRIALSPIAGTLVDRWNRRWTMILSDAGAAVCTLGIGLLFYLDQVSVWSLSVLMGLGAVSTVFQSPAYQASITLLVPEDQLNRASGMVQIAESLTQVVAPAIAAALLVIMAPEGIILIDLVTFLAAIGTLLAVRIPQPESTEDGEISASSLYEEMVEGWTVVRATPGLLLLMGFLTAVTFFAMMMQALATPLLLTFTSITIVGVISSILGVGLVAGSAGMTAWSGPDRRVYGILGFGALQGLALVLAGLRPNVLLAGFAFFLWGACMPSIRGYYRVVIQTTVAPDVQGRAFGVSSMITNSVVPLAFLIAGPLADQVFEPLMQPGGTLAPVLGPILGTGEGRGIGLLVVACGVIYVLAAGASFLSPSLRELGASSSASEKTTASGETSAPDETTAASARSMRDEDVSESSAAPAAETKADNAGEQEAVLAESGVEQTDA